MPSIGAAELVLILLIAFIVVGPKDLPKVARAIARLIKKARVMIREIQKETGLDELTNDFKDISKELKETRDSLDIRKDLQDAGKEINDSIKDVKKEVTSSINDAKTEVSTSIKEAQAEVKTEAKAAAGDIKAEVESGVSEMDKQTTEIKKDLSFKEFKELKGGNKK